jgi:hypothetical protein
MTPANANLALMGIGAVGSAFGAYYSAKSSKNNLRFQAQMAEINARMAELGAKDQLLRGEREVQASRLKTAQIKSAQRAGMAANGIDLGEGTAGQVLAGTEVMGEIDANTIAANAVKSAWGYRMQATNCRGEAAVGRATASGINPGASALTSLLSDSGQVTSSWYAMNKTGAK